MNGLDLFSGIGGLSLALAPWVTTVAYCEIDSYARGVLLSRMQDGGLTEAPIWDDVRTLRGDDLPPPIDIIYGGFPCQDLSLAGRRKGLDGERSGLFYEIVRLVDEVRPRFVFLENVPGIRQHAHRVFAELASRGYDARWLHLAASDVGAPHRRERWWCLAADANRDELRDERRRRVSRPGQAGPGDDGAQELVAHPNAGDTRPVGDANSEGQLQQGGAFADVWRRVGDPGWWSAEPDVGRVAHGVSKRVDRLSGLGNAVVPAQAREAFEILSGLRRHGQGCA